MFDNVILAIEESASAHDVISVARAVAPGAKLTLATVYPYPANPDHPRHSAYGETLREAALRMLAARRVASGLEDAEIHAIADTSPANGLKQFAADQNADLLVLGSSSKGAIGRIVLGDTAHAVLHGSPCPVLVPPHRTTAVGATPEIIGVAYNGTPESEEALVVAEQVASRTGARLDVVRAMDIDVSSLPWHAQLIDYLKSLLPPAREQLDSRAARLGVPAATEVTEGSAHDVLSKLAGRVDLLVCGSRTWGFGVSFGSTAERLMHHAPCPVLVVPRSAVAAGAVEPIDVPAAVVAPRPAFGAAGA